MEAKASGHEAAKQNTKKIVPGLKKPTPAATYEDLIRVSLLFEEPSLMLINKSSA
jgi:hypothetical protein